MKKILIIIGSLDLGGTEKQLFKILKKIHKDFDIHLALVWKKGKLYKDFIKLNIKIYKTFERKKYNSKLIGIMSELWGLKKKISPKIIHYYLPHAYLIGGFLSIFKDKTTFFMSRRSMNNYQKKIFVIKLIEICLHKKMDLIIGNSSKVIGQLVKEEFVKKEKCLLIYNGVEKQKFIKRRKKRVVNIIMLANFISYKNHRMAIEAFSLLDKTLNWRLSLIGNHTDKQLVHSLINLTIKLKLKKQIFFVEQIENINSYLKKADIGILSSNEEGFSNSLLEYMSFSLPVVATDVGGNSDLISENSDGFLVKQNDAMNFSQKLHRLILDYDLRIKFGKNGNKKISDKFDIIKCANTYKKLYKSM